MSLFSKNLKSIVGQVGLPGVLGSLGVSFEHLLEVLDAPFLPLVFGAAFGSHLLDVVQASWVDL